MVPVSVTLVGRPEGREERWQCCPSDMQGTRHWHLFQLLINTTTVIVPSEVPILAMVTLKSSKDDQLPTAEIHSFIEWQ